MLNLLKKFAREEDGQDIVEYALLIAGVALTVFPMAQGLTGAVQGVFTRATTAMQTGTP